MRLTERQKDILIAGAIGDAVGYLVEFRKLKRIMDEYGHNGLRLDMIQPGAKLTVSDDTQMTLFALEALHLSASREQYQKSYIQWFYTQTREFASITSPLAQFRSMQYQRAPGSTCLGALSKLQRGEFLEPINDSKGCGGIMRAAPFAFLPRLADAWEQGKVQAAVTHGHPSGYLSAAYFSALLHQFLNDGSITLGEALDECNGFLVEEPGYLETYDAVDLAMRIATMSSGDHYSDIKRIGEGWIGEEALAIAIYAVYTATTFEQAVDIAINHDGDSDSTGSLAAQLWAAMYIFPDQYREWASRLDIANAFEYVTNGNNYE